MPWIPRAHWRPVRLSPSLKEKTISAFLRRDCGNYSWIFLLIFFLHKSCWRHLFFFVQYALKRVAWRRKVTGREVEYISFHSEFFDSCCFWSKCCIHVASNPTLFLPKTSCRSSSAHFCSREDEIQVYLSHSQSVVETDLYKHTPTTEQGRQINFLPYVSILACRSGTFARTNNTETTRTSPYS